MKISTVTTLILLALLASPAARALDFGEQSLIAQIHTACTQYQAYRLDDGVSDPATIAIAAESKCHEEKVDAIYELMQPKNKNISREQVAKYVRDDKPAARPKLIAVTLESRVLRRESVEKHAKKVAGLKKIFNWLKKQDKPWRPSHKKRPAG